MQGLFHGLKNMPNRLQMICNEIVSQKTIVHQTITGQDPAMNTQFQNRARLPEVPRKIQNLYQTREIQVDRGPTTHLQQGRAIVFRSQNNRKHTQVPAGQAAVFQPRPAQPQGILHHQGLQGVIHQDRPAHLVAAGLQVVAQVEAAGHQVEVTEEADSFQHSDF